MLTMLARSLFSVCPIRHAVRNVRDIASRRTPAIAKIGRVDAATIVLAQSRKHRARAPLVSPVVQVLLEMLHASADHGGDL
jgi:hypothetical protein